MRTKDVRMAVARLKSMVEEYKAEQPINVRDWRTYEQQYCQRLKYCFDELLPLIKEAVSMIKIIKTERRGNEPKLTLEQKVILLLLKQLCIKSNRSMAGMVIIFSWLTSINIGYKTIERLYSDPLVQMALFNLHVLILKKKGIDHIDCAGDGTGYTLLIKEHYASEAQRLKDSAKENNAKDKKKIKCVYSFTIIDIESRLYVGYGTSLTSEKEAFLAAIAMLKGINIEIGSLRLDRYYSGEYYVNLLREQLGEMRFFIIPKSNVATIGVGAWGKMLISFVEDIKAFLEDYFQRNQSESGFAEDKKRTGWKIFQKKPDRICTANAIIYAWHNLQWAGI